MSDLYKEAIAEAKKLKQIAEDDAKQTIVDEITPFIKKVISEEINGATHSQFFFEQEEEEPEAVPGLDGMDAPPAPDASPDMAGVMPGGETAQDVPVTDPMATDDLGAGLGDQPEEAPLGANGEDILSATMPDAEGKITVDFDDLFSDVDEPAAPAAEGDLDLGAMPGAEDPLAAPPAAPAGEDDLSSLDDLGGDLESPPADAPLAPGAEEEEELPMESLVYEKFEKSLSKVSEKIDREFFSNSANDLVQESLKTSLFKLLEQHDYLKEVGLVPRNRAKSTENKLEFLFLKLKEANSGNTYKKKDHKDNSMTSLKEYAAKLFEEDSTYADDGDKEGTNQPTTADAKHAADVSGVDPNLGSSGPEDLEGREEDGNPGGINEEMLAGTAGSVDHEPLPNTDPEPGSEEQWADGEPSLDEENQDKVIEEALDSLEEEVEAEGHAGFGDTNEGPATEFEVSDREIAEAVRDIRKKGIQEKMRALREASDGSDSSESWEDGEPEGRRNASHENLKEGADMDDDGEELNEMSYMDDDDADDMPGVPEMEDDDMDDMGGMDSDEDDMGGEGDLVLNISLPDEVADALASVDVASMDDIQVSLSDVNLGSDFDDEGGDMEPPMPGAGIDDVVMDDGPEMEEESFQRERAVYEAKLRKAGKLYKALKSQTAKYKTDLREANLFLAKNVYFTKFLQRGDLSQKNLTKIVEYLDGAKTVKEAKTVYGKIKTKLSESARASKKLTGSAAQATKPGSAKSLNESVSRKDTSDPVVNTPARWQHLAGIKKSQS